ncbi:16S rRNA (guanine1207-N2)-methyltransferase [Streptomyces sp. CG 926]|uniref:methyltransferase n=1 Tax=Streptomyces sp. CG 926 TaxID=1882405 RepID=UPI000D6C7B10|nr:methyltransferase [Streptomyces sp. CG 926]PWK65064.1 16S rRNA (guanine1207-N2)-methyltransferase [Streptomyces sp. CG 926]
MNRLTTPFGSYELTRFPEDPRDRLRAWDAADEYLLRHLDSGTGERGPVDLTAAAGRITVLGDRWGTLTTALAAHRPTQITDSALTRAATAANLDRAGIGTAKSTVTLLTTQDPPPERIDVLLVRVPKSLALLEDQLYRLAPHVHAGTVVVGTGMVKEIHTSTLRLFEKILGPTKTSLAEKKARLIFCTPGTPGATRPTSTGPWPLTYTVDEDAGSASGLSVVNHAGIFCADRLDVGTRFFLQNLPTNTDGARVVDLGCGNGVVGTAVQAHDPDAEVVFTDESYQAVASARETYRANIREGRRTAEFHVGDGVAMLSPGSVDLVLSNPPFHSHQATTDATALRMFAQSRKVLRPGGELWIVANRHMGYHTHLRRLFGNSEVVASEPKFVVLRAVKQDRPRPM